ncbi:MAG: 1,4-dihydroxy-2-naphthoate polyprenyltransferase [Bacilli bacterium]
MKMNNTVQIHPYRPMTIKIFWHLIRPHTLTAAFIPVFIGSMFAVHGLNITFRYDMFFIFLLACLLIQAATNIFNEYYDWKRGLDTEEAVGIGGTIVRENVSPIVVRNTGFILYALSILLGVYLCSESSWYVALVGIVSMIVGFLYTGGPLPIAYTPFGEVFAGTFMGAIIVNLGFYFQTDTITIQSLIISLPISFLIAAILLANNIRDFDNDKEKGRKTLAILLGKKRARTALLLHFFGAYFVVVLLTMLSYSHVSSLIVFFSIPLALKAYRGFKNKETPKEMMPAMALTAKTNTAFGLLLCLSFIIALVA